MLASLSRAATRGLRCSSRFTTSNNRALMSSAPVATTEKTDAALADAQLNPTFDSETYDHYQSVSMAEGASVLVNTG